MLTTTDAIELHDSSATFRRDGKSVIVSLCPAYVHHWEHSGNAWQGEGRVQHAEIVIHDGLLSSDVGGEVLDIAGGWFEIADEVHSNLIPASLDTNSAIRGHFEIDSGLAIEVSGVGLRIRLVGEHRRMESLPSEWAPVGHGLE